MLQNKLLFLLIASIVFTINVGMIHQLVFLPQNLPKLSIFSHTHLFHLVYKKQESEI